MIIDKCLVCHDNSYSRLHSVHCLPSMPNSRVCDVNQGPV